MKWRCSVNCDVRGKGIGGHPLSLEQTVVDPKVSAPVFEQHWQRQSARLHYGRLRELGREACDWSSFASAFFNPFL